MQNISRKDLRFNFLKSIIVRIDFEGVLEPEMQNVLTLVKPLVKSKGFTRYSRKKNGEIQISIENLDEPETAQGKVIKNHEIHSFINEDRGYVLDLSRSFVCLNISSTGYTPFEDYCALVSEINNIYQKNIDFFSVNRVGVRKINVCLFEDKERINDFFSTKYFGYFNSPLNVNTFSSNRRDIFEIDKYQGNLSCNIEQGSSGNEILYKVTLDTDIYTNNVNVIKESIDLNAMNDILFDIYISSLTDSFKTALCGDDESLFNGIKGVERNE